MLRVIDATAGDETVLRRDCVKTSIIIISVKFKFNYQYLQIGNVENQQWLKEIILKTHTLSIIRSSMDLIIISLKINLFLPRES